MGGGLASFLLSEYYGLHSVSLLVVRVEEVTLFGPVPFLPSHHTSESLEVHSFTPKRCLGFFKVYANPITLDPCGVRRHPIDFAEPV
jgi:hypothetical protein